MEDLDRYKEHIRRQFVCKFITSRTTNKELDKIGIKEAYYTVTQFAIDSIITPTWISVANELREYYYKNNSATLNDWVKEVE